MMEHSRRTVVCAAWEDGDEVALDHEVLMEGSSSRKHAEGAKMVEQTVVGAAEREKDEMALAFQPPQPPLPTSLSPRQETQ